MVVRLALLVFIVSFYWFSGVCLQARPEFERRPFIALPALQPETEAGVAEGKAEIETRAFFAALSNLEYFMQAGIENDVSRAAPLLSSFMINRQRARVDTKRLFRENLKLLEDYVSVSSDVYGYEFTNDRFGASVQFEGRVETRQGMMAEYEATMVLRDNKWLIWSLDID